MRFSPRAASCLPVAFPTGGQMVLPNGGQIVPLGVPAFEVAVQGPREFLASDGLDVMWSCGAFWLGGRVGVEGVDLGQDAVGCFVEEEVPGAGDGGGGGVG